MGQCVAKVEVKNDQNMWEKVNCGKQTEIGYRYCDEHKTRKRAIEEREKKSLSNIVDATEAFTGQVEPQDAPSEVVEAKKVEALPATNRGNIFERTMQVLDRAQDWEEETWQLLKKLTPDEMRYTDKAGAEQQHSFVGMNERAQDRTIRAVTAIAKLDIDAQSVNVNKMVQEIVKSVVTKALTRAGIENQQIEQVRIFMAEEFERVAKEAG
jgi:hypothetical protein